MYIDNVYVYRTATRLLGFAHFTIKIEDYADARRRPDSRSEYTKKDRENDGEGERHKKEESIYKLVS